MEETVSPKRRIESYPFLFGAEGQDTVFSFELEVPDLEEVFLSFPLGTDALVFVNGNPECNVNPYHEIMNISRWKGQQTLFEIRCWDGYIYPGWHPLQKAHLLTVTGREQQDYPIMLGQPAILSKNVNQYELWYNLVVITETVLELDPENIQRQQVMPKLHKALMEMSLVTEDTAVLEAQTVKVLETTHRILDAKNGTIAPKVYYVGMAHLDHAWVWPKRETLRKAERTQSGMLHLMEEHLEFVFLCTQPVQMDHVFAKYPILYKRALEMFRREDIEFLRRMKDFQGCPRSSWITMSKAMERIFSETSELPVYEGEMYFELHGTYTSQALMKQGYRRTNALLHDAEYLLSFVWAKKRISDERCREFSSSIREIWKTTVVNQFHDILPGSCVGIEYEEVNAFYEEAG